MVEVATFNNFKTIGKEKLLKIFIFPIPNTLNKTANEVPTLQFLFLQYNQNLIQNKT